jgi:uncharacterized repeat protein (TIGR03803 family)
MPGQKISAKLTAMLVIVTAALLSGAFANAQQLKILRNFGDKNTVGALVDQGLTFDAAGNLYGAAVLGGNGVDTGVIFELTPKAGGGWTDKVLHQFGPDNDGSEPNGGLVFDPAGNLYGTTLYGGAWGYGTVFELTPTATGVWTETILHSFKRYKGLDGLNPKAGLVLDAAGNLYGTTDVGAGSSCGVPDACGTVFELIHEPGGSWTEKVLHQFGAGEDGKNPEAGLIFDALGNLYGTTTRGGANNCGVAFELMPSADGSWTEQVLHSFSGTGPDGCFLRGGLIMDASGNLYGTTMVNGANGFGTAFELTPDSGGSWTEQVLHSFGNTTKDGSEPAAGLSFDAAGNLYGTTLLGGISNYGTVFELVAEPDGSWTEKVLHRFQLPGGIAPFAGVISDAAGNLYGATTRGGLHNIGTLFEIVR